MTLPASGALSLWDIHTEFGYGQKLSDYVGKKWAKPNGETGTFTNPVAISDFYGKTGLFEFAIASDQTNANLRTLAVNAGWNTRFHVRATLNPGRWISSNNTSVPALTINGTWSTGVTFANKGTVHGMGGAGGRSDRDWEDNTGNPGGVALAVSSTSSVYIDNGQGVIAGGGGGGGVSFRGDGGGGGQTGLTNAAGGAVANPPSAPGSPGTKNGPGAGGRQGSYTPAGAGGTSGQSGESSEHGHAGGAGGAAVTGNSNITWIATGTRKGPIT